MKTLKEIFDSHLCDKGTKRHRYDRVYEPVFHPLRDKQIELLEIGVLRGESLESHLEFFPNATMTSIDIFGRVPAKDVPALQDERVNWCNCNSISGPNDAFNNIAPEDGFDIIIDDGLHTHNSQQKTFENFIPYLKKDGVYFIEDVWAFDRMTDKQKQHPWVQKHHNDYTDEKYEKLLRALKPYKVKFHDLRKNYHPDTFIIEVRK